MTIEASYVVGCDGANSKVRNLSAITCTDLNFQNDWLILDLVCFGLNYNQVWGD